MLTATLPDQRTKEYGRGGGKSSRASLSAMTAVQAAGQAGQIVFTRGGVSESVHAVHVVVVDGEVRMRRNFALEDAEIAAGFVLTCQSTAVTEKVNGPPRSTSSTRLKFFDSESIERFTLNEFTHQASSA